MIVQFPPVATPVPITVVPSNTVTMLPASAVPVKVGLATSVMLSVLDTPVSDAAIRSGADRDSGGHRVDGDRQSSRRGADFASHIGYLGGDGVGSGRKGCGGHGPRPGGGYTGADQPGAVVQRNRVADLCHAGEGRVRDVRDIVRIGNTTIGGTDEMSGGGRRRHRDVGQIKVLPELSNPGSSAPINIVPVRVIAGVVFRDIFDTRYEASKLTGWRAGCDLFPKGATVQDRRHSLDQSKGPRFLLETLAGSSLRCCR